MEETEKKKKKFNWTELIAVTLLMLLAVGVTFGITWYVMDGQAIEEQAVLQSQIDSLKTINTALVAKTKVEEKADTTTASAALTAAMVEGGTYTLSGVKVTLAEGKATVGENIYTLDTKNVAYTTDKTKAVIVINQTAGTSTTPVNTYVVAVNNKDGKANQLAAATVASGSNVTAVSYGSDGKITITTTSAVLATPTTKIYTISGTTFTEAK